MLPIMYIHVQWGALYFMYILINAKNIILRGECNFLSTKSVHYLLYNAICDFLVLVRFLF